MNTLGTKLNLVDVASRLDPDGRIAPIAEILNETNPILDDMPWMEGNLPTGHRYTRRLSLPSPTWRKLNSGVVPGKSSTTQEDAACAMLEAYSECDKKIADLNGNTAAFRLSEGLAFVESMNQTFAQQIIYGDTSTNPDGVLGLTPRYNSLSATNASSANIIDASFQALTDSIIYKLMKNRDLAGRIAAE